MSSREIEEQLKSVGLKMPPYWSAKYLKNADKLSRPLYKIKEERDVYVPVRDGVKLCMDIFRPDADGKFPALFAPSGYPKDIQSLKIPPQPVQSFVFDHDVEAGDIDFFVSRGYVHIILDARGTGKSEGEWWGPYNILEQQDCYDVVEWIARQTWCNGNVGMIGISWFGVIQRLTAAQQPPHLKAIFPVEAIYDLFRWACGGGIYSTHYWVLENEITAHSPRLESEKLYTKEELQCKFKERLEDPDIKNNFYWYRVLSNLEKIRKHTAFADMLLHPSDGPFWWERSGHKKYDRIKIPVYEGSFWGEQQLTGGVFDSYTDPELKVLKRAGIFMHSTRLTLPGPRELNPEILRWYDHWLKGIDTGMMDEPPIKILVMGINRFRYEKEWPLARTKWTKYYLRRFGELAVEPEGDEEIPPDTLVHHPPIASNKIETLTYSTSPMTQPLEVTGPVALHIYASIDQDDAHFIARLCDVSPNGKSLILEKGRLKASHRTLDENKSKPWRPYHSHLKPEPVKPGQIYEYSISIGYISNVFQPNHFIELQMTTMDPLPQIYHHKMMLMSHLPRATLTYHKIHRDAKYQSHLLLPVIPETPEEAYI